MPISKRNARERDTSPPGGTTKRRLPAICGKAHGCQDKGHCFKMKSHSGMHQCSKCMRKFK